jgi:flagellar hook-associated protein 3 FlgL
MSIGIVQTGLTAIAMQGASAIQQQITQLTEQASTGKQADAYDGLAPGATQTALSLQPQVAALTTTQNNISSATAQMGVTQTTLTQISSIASGFYTQLADLNGLSPGETDSIAASAQQALQQVAELLDTQQGGSYIFAGTDSSNPPVPDASNILSSGFYTQISASVAALGTNGAAATAATAITIAASNTTGTSPFSATLSQPAATVNANLPQVATGDGTTATVGIAASANAFGPSTGSDTTGSYMRDIMMSLAEIGSLTDAQQNSGADVTGLVTSLYGTLGGAITALNQDAGVLGNTQTSLTNQASTMASTQTALTSQVSNVEDANMATVISNITEVQSRLEASYKLVSELSSLSLAQYLSAS